MNGCTIIARNYLAQARVLAETFREHHPDGRFFVLVIDLAFFVARGLFIVARTFLLAHRFFVFLILGRSFHIARWFVFVLDTGLHQRTPLVVGSAEEVELLRRMVG